MHINTSYRAAIFQIWKHRKEKYIVYNKLKNTNTMYQLENKILNSQAKGCALATYLMPNNGTNSLFSQCLNGVTPFKLKFANKTWELTGINKYLFTKTSLPAVMFKNLKFDNVVPKVQNLNLDFWTLILHNLSYLLSHNFALLQCVIDFIYHKGESF
jgi:Golgi nucleoside diphosphatase